MQNRNRPAKLIRLVTMIMEKSEAAVTKAEGNTKPFKFEAGVRQGYALSTTLCNISLEGVFQDPG